MLKAEKSRKKRQNFSIEGKNVQRKSSHIPNITLQEKILGSSIKQVWNDSLKNVISQQILILKV